MARKVKTEEENIEVYDVKNEDELEKEMADFMAEMGVEADWNEDLDDGLGIPQGFQRIELKNMEDEEEFEGKPMLSEIKTTKFTDKNTGEETINHTVSLVLIDEMSEEAYIYPIGIKTNEEIQVNVHNASKLYSLVMGLMELKQKGVSQHYNELPKVNLESLRKMISKFESMTVECKTVYGDFTWNNFRITDAE